MASRLHGLLILAASCALTHAVLTSGITHLWTTPLLRHILVDPKGTDADLLTSMDAAIRNRFHAFQETCGPLEDGETVNDRFFAFQREAFESGKASFLETETDSAQREAFATLSNAWLENAREYLATAKGSDEEASELFDDEASGLRMFVWASVHTGESSHVPHVHANSAVSGVFYISVPDEAGVISFHDPRAAFAESQSLEHRPTAGELLLFPPWLIHGVEPGENGQEPRISISFNVFSLREEGTDFNMLANTAVRLARPPDAEAEEL